VRYTVGVLKGAEIGTLFGPKDITGDYLVCFDAQGSLGYASQHEIADAYLYIAQHGPRSVTEYKIYKGLKNLV
jgi:hypothetical protein